MLSVPALTLAVPAPVMVGAVPSTCVPPAKSTGRCRSRRELSGARLGAATRR